MLSEIMFWESLALWASTGNYPVTVALISSCSHQNVEMLMLAHITF